MDKANEWTNDLGEAISPFLKWAATCCVETAFLAFWVGCQWLLNQYITSYLILEGFKKIVYSIFQVLFAISTLAPIIFTIYRDIRIMYLKTQQAIRREIQIGEYDETK